MNYIIEISILSKAPQNINKTLKMGDIELKNKNNKIDLKDVIRAVKKQFKFASIPRIVTSSINEEEFRVSIRLEIKSFRGLVKPLCIQGIEKSMFSIKVKEVYVK